MTYRVAGTVHPLQPRRAGDCVLRETERERDISRFGEFAVRLARGGMQESDVRKPAAKLLDVGCVYRPRLHAVMYRDEDVHGASAATNVMTAFAAAFLHEAD